MLQINGSSAASSANRLIHGATNAVRLFSSRSNSQQKSRFWWSVRLDSRGIREDKPRIGHAGKSAPRATQSEENAKHLHGNRAHTCRRTRTNLYCKRHGQTPPREMKSSRTATRHQNATLPSQKGTLTPPSAPPALCVDPWHSMVSIVLPNTWQS